MHTHSHAIVWLDHKTAKVMSFNANDNDAATVLADPPTSHIHTKAGSPSGVHLHGDPAYFAEIADRLAGAQTFVVVGPSAAREEFAAYLRTHQAPLAARLAGVAPQDKRTDRQLLAFARAYFRRRDRMTPQS